MSESSDQNISSSELSCSQCHDVEFSSPSALQKHIETEHSEGRLEPHQCPVQGCSFSSTRIGGVKAHLLSHAPKKDKEQVAKPDAGSEGDVKLAPAPAAGNVVSVNSGNTGSQGSAPARAAGKNMASVDQQRCNSSGPSVVRNDKAPVRFAPYARPQSSGPSMQMAGGPAGPAAAATRIAVDPRAIGPPPPSAANFHAPVNLPGPMVHNPMPPPNHAFPLQSATNGQYRVAGPMNPPPLQQLQQPYTWNVDLRLSVAPPPRLVPQPPSNFPQGVPDVQRLYLESNIISRSGQLTANPHQAFVTQSQNTYIQPVAPFPTMQSTQTYGNQVVATNGHGQVGYQQVGMPQLGQAVQDCYMHVTVPVKVPAEILALMRARDGL